ncbi:MAG TPA: serine hydrolase [Gemmatimonadaceae bacterium]|nr:serine hydrolase [Gemmatimonadaceae bacterium]
MTHLSSRSIAPRARGARTLLSAVLLAGTAAAPLTLAPAAVAATLVALPAGAYAQQRAGRAPDMAALDRYVARAARDWDVPGLAIAVVKGDSLVFAKGYGVIEQGKPARVDEHTRFAIGSTTKAMTVTALAMLADEGKLSFDDRVIDHLPNFRLHDAWATRELTIRDLLTHRTGLPGTDLLWIFDSYPADEIFRRIRYVEPESSFRSHWEYQNVMYALAGAIVEEASGMSWADFLRKRIFEPLGMTETIPLVAELPGKPNVAVPHAEEGDSVRVVSIRTTDPVAPAGSVWSSVHDMSIWMRFVLDSGRVGDKRLVKPETFREMVAPEMRAPMNEYPALQLSRPHFFSYAIGWFVQDYQGETVWMHTGSIDGMSAIIGLLPGQRAGVYVLANLDHAELRHALMYRVFDMYEGNQPRDWSAELHKLFADRGARMDAARAKRDSSRAKNTHPTLPLAKYVGTYNDSTYGNVDITLAGDALRFRFVKGDAQPLEHLEYDSFQAKAKNTLEPDPMVSFVLDGSGGVSALRAFGVEFRRTRTDAN